MEWIAEIKGVSVPVLNKFCASLEEGLIHMICREYPSNLVNAIFLYL